MSGMGKKGYENFIVIAMFMAYGLIMMDRLTLAFLFPFLGPELHMDGKQFGMAMSVLGICWAVSSYVFGSISDFVGGKKWIFIISTFVFSVASVFTGMSHVFLFLLLTRAVMGIAEGPAIGLTQVFTAANSSNERRGLNMGIVQSASLLVGTSLAPMLVISITLAYGWRAAFNFVAIPGIILALVCMKYLKEPVMTTKGHAGQTHQKITMADYAVVFKQRNTWVCLITAVGMMTWYLTSNMFFTSFFINVKHFTPGQAAILMGILGFASFLSQWSISAISDRFGRKPVMAISGFITVVAVFALLQISDFTIACVVGGLLYLGTGFPPLMMAIIPSESVPRPLIATAIGLIIMGGEIIGGVLVPTIAGIMADKFGLAAPVWISLSGAVLVFVFSFALKESAPQKLEQMGLVNEYLEEAAPEAA